MSHSSYTPFEDLESLANHAASKVVTGERFLNFFVSGEIPFTSIRDRPLEDVTEKANKWRAEKRPAELIINHGEFIRDGLKHIIDELKGKPDSNRALYSLISQKHIIGYGDEPIPSFMVFQCAIKEDILYCTAYFRALEVSNFFRINLEEIRLNICDILSDIIPVSKIRLSILAFSAYNKPDQIPLERCEIDLYSSIKIMDMYESEPSRISELLDQKAKVTTVIDITGLEAIKAWLAPDRKSKWPHKLNVPKIISAIDNAISTANELSRLRQSSSHAQRIDEVSQLYVQKIKLVAEEFRKCL